MSNIISLADARKKRGSAQQSHPYAQSSKPLNPLFLLVAVIAWALLA